MSVPKVGGWLRLPPQVKLTDAILPLMVESGVKPKSIKNLFQDSILKNTWNWRTKRKDNSPSLLPYNLNCCFKVLDQNAKLNKTTENISYVVRLIEQYKKGWGVKVKVTQIFWSLHKVIRKQFYRNDVILRRISCINIPLPLNANSNGEWVGELLDLIILFLLIQYL